MAKIFLYISLVFSFAKIEDVFRHYGFKLKKSGKSYKTKCPFYDDHDPSMTITPSLNICKCFSCGLKAMDPIDFVERYEKVSFIHAVKKLASISGIYVTDETRTELNLTPMKQKKQYKKPTPRPITELSRKLVTWFESRGISEPTLKKMCISPFIHCRFNCCYIDTNIPLRDIGNSKNDSLVSLSLGQ